VLRIHSVTFHRFDCWQNWSAELDPSTNMISGPNGSGKTSLIDGIRLAFNAPRLSSGRRLGDYVADRRKRTVVKLVVDNRKGPRSRRPFGYPGGFTTDLVTLGCTIVYRNSGPQKRFFLLPGDQPLERIREVVDGEHDWLKPEEYSRMIARAGVSRSLMELLAIEQGETHRFCQKSPRELFTTVMHAMGSQEILDNYREAKLKYDAARTHLNEVKGQLGGEERKLNELRGQRDEYLVSRVTSGKNRAWRRRSSRFPGSASSGRCARSFGWTWRATGAT